MIWRQIVARGASVANRSRWSRPVPAKRLAELVFAFSVPYGGGASADMLATFLDSVSQADRLSTPLRADGAIESDGIKGKAEDRIVLVERASPDPKAPREVYVELEKSKVHLLALTPAELHLAADGKPAKTAADGPFVSTSFTAEDFLPFSAARCAATRIADISEEQFTIVCEPKKPPSQYSLMVYKFDRAKFVMRQVLLYKGAMTNLVKMLRNDDFTEVGSKWRPKRIVMQDFKLRTQDTISLQWQASASVPASAFDPKSFAASSLLQASARKP